MIRLTRQEQSLKIKQLVGEKMILPSLLSAITNVWVIVQFLLKIEISSNFVKIYTHQFSFHANRQIFNSS